MRIRQYLFPMWELILLAAGFLLIYQLPHRIEGDSYERFNFVFNLVEKHKIIPTRYSSVGPLFSLPFYYLGKLMRMPCQGWGCECFNFFVVLLGTIAIYFLLKNKIAPYCARRFIFILLFATMVTTYQKGFGGEIFTSFCAGVGILLIDSRYALTGWSLLLLGVLNTPATLLGLFFVILHKSCAEKKARYLMLIPLMILLHFTDSWIRFGNFLGTANFYVQDKGVVTIMPYSGRPGFSYPLLFGLLSVFFSFGKGLLFFFPALLLLPKARHRAMDEGLSRVYLRWLLFLGGLILVYARNWGWYGGWTWGPRYFLFASIPASLALALNIAYPSRGFWKNLVVMVVLFWSFWVNLSGVLFGLHGLQWCIENNYSLEYLVWYVPEFSVLFHPFISPQLLHRREKIFLIYSIILAVYIVLPITKALIGKAKEYFIAWGRKGYSDLRVWRF